MYSETKLKQIPFNVPMLLTFRRRVKENRSNHITLPSRTSGRKVALPAGSYELKLVCSFIETFQYWSSWKDHYLIQTIAIDMNRPEAWHGRCNFVNERHTPFGYDRSINYYVYPLYLQSVEPFPLTDLPLLFSWTKRWDVFETLLKGE
jgi:hypothetical protein